MLETFYKIKGSGQVLQQELQLVCIFICIHFITISSKQSKRIFYFIIYLFLKLIKNLKECMVFFKHHFTSAIWLYLVVYWE